MGQNRYLRILNGQERGPAAVLLRGLLRLASLPYRVVIAVRNRAYDLGLCKSHRVQAPVISIGNLTTGGTGKTPFVAYVTDILLALGMRPGIISRGYGADSSGENDEKRVLDRLNPGIPHLQNPSRISSARALTESKSADCLVMDDGFQHRALYRDLDIVLIDACNPYGYNSLLPRGLLREPVSSLQRAAAVLITRCDLVSAEELNHIESRIQSAGGPAHDRVFRTRFVPVRLISADGRDRSLSEVSGSPCWLMSGIGNPSAFEATCRIAGLQPLGQTTFRDHHLYSEADLRGVLELAKSQSAAFVVTTLKDLVKTSAAFSEIWAIDIRPEFCRPADESAFRQLIQQAVAKNLNETDCSSPAGAQ